MTGSLTFGVFMAIGALVSASWAATKMSGALRAGLITQASLALFFAGSDIWLRFNEDDVLGWAETMRWVRIVLAWPIVWIFPPILLVREHRRRGQHLVEEAESLAERYGPGK